MLKINPIKILQNTKPKTPTNPLKSYQCIEFEFLLGDELKEVSNGVLESEKKYRPKHIKKLNDLMQVKLINEAHELKIMKSPNEFGNFVEKAYAYSLKSPSYLKIVPSKIKSRFLRTKYLVDTLGEKNIISLDVFSPDMRAIIQDKFAQTPGNYIEHNKKLLFGTDKFFIKKAYLNGEWAGVEIVKHFSFL